MSLSIYLSFNGQCEEAFKFYEKCLGGKITFALTFGNSPAANQAPAEWRNKIMHSSLVVGDRMLSGADAPPDRYQKPQGFAVTIEIKEPAEAERIFNALRENGQVQMPMQETFWAHRFGMLTDQFGIPWMVNCSKPA